MLKASPSTTGGQVRELIALAAPLLGEQFLNILVGLTDTYLGNNLSGDGAVNAAAAAAVGSLTYVLWLVGLIAAAIGTGATAIVARSIGAGNRREANACTGQSLFMALVIGGVAGVALLAFAPRLAPLFGLADAQASGFVATYLRLLGVGLPAAVLLFTTNACLRGAGDTLTPSLAMAAVNVVNVALSFVLTYGLGPLPALGFTGIAAGTTVAYVLGGAISLAVLLTGRGGLRLHPRRVRPRAAMMRRVLRIGLPAGAEGLVHWSLNFVVLREVNRLDNVAAAAHNAVIRLEAFSYLAGYAVSIAAATMVGQALGRRDERGAWRAAWLSFGLGGGIMVLVGLSFIVLPRPWAVWLTDNPAITDATADVLRLTGFAQLAFAAVLVFGGAMRGAGATASVMTVNLASGLLLRLVGVLVVRQVYDLGLMAVWYVLMGELCVRGLLMTGLFVRGRWVDAKV